MKTKVIMKDTDHKYGDWQKDDKGYIIGFSHSSDGRPFLSVDIGERVILCAVHDVRVMED